jgi:hypothetical protein
MDDDYKQGDVMGCMIHLPSFEEIMAQGLFTPSEILPSSKKECDVIRFKNRIFFEEKETTKEALKRLRPLLGSKVIGDLINFK